jgi:LysM repeat protein
MPLPSRDELRERLAAGVESLGVTVGELTAGARRAYESRPHMGRALGIGAAVVVLAGVVVAVVAGHRGGEVGQLVVPAVTPTARPPEQTSPPSVGAPPNPGAPPEPGAASPEPGNSTPVPAPAAAAPAPPVPTPAAAAPAPPVPAPPVPTPAAAAPAPPVPAPPVPAPAASAPTSTTAPTSAAAAPTATQTAPTSTVAPGADASGVPAPETAPGQEGVALPTEHDVVAGETLARIALRYGVPFEQIAADSGIPDVNRIRPGQHLRIRPVPAGVEIIKPGRTLSDYARSSGRRVDELMRLNPRITDPGRILAGGRLHV